MRQQQRAFGGHPFLSDLIERPLGMEQVEAFTPLVEIAIDQFRRPTAPFPQFAPLVPGTRAAQGAVQHGQQQAVESRRFQRRIALHAAQFVGAQESLAQAEFFDAPV